MESNGLAFYRHCLQHWLFYFYLVYRWEKNHPMKNIDSKFKIYIQYEKREIEREQMKIRILIYVLFLSAVIPNIVNIKNPRHHWFQFRHLFMLKCHQRWNLLCAVNFHGIIRWIWNEVSTVHMEWPIHIRIFMRIHSSRPNVHHNQQSVLSRIRIELIMVMKSKWLLSIENRAVVVSSQQLFNTQIRKQTNKKSTHEKSTKNLTKTPFEFWCREMFEAEKNQ